MKEFFTKHKTTIIVVIIIAIAVWYFFLRKKKGVAVASSTTTTTTTEEKKFVGNASGGQKGKNYDGIGGALFDVVPDIKNYNSNYVGNLKE